MSCGALHAENNEPNKKSLITKQEHTTSLGSKSGTTSTSISHIDLMASIRKFNKDNCHLILDKDFDSNITIAERVILGFQQSPPKSLSLKDGTQIVWGWQEGQAWIQSVAILDNNNVAKVLGIAENIPRIFSWRSRRGLISISDFDDLLENRRSIYIREPRVVFFTANQEDANRYYNFALRWIQANLLGFNSECSNPAYTASCTLAEKIKIPIFIQNSKCCSAESQEMTCAVRIPDHTQSEVPLDMFKQ